MGLTENEALEKVAEQWDKMMREHNLNLANATRVLHLCSAAAHSAPVLGLSLPIPTCNFEIPAGSLSSTFVIVRLILCLSLHDRLSAPLHLACQSNPPITG
ncbi:hypothetical protein EUGRSUZ_C00585 [Eucalyptus grandis]|uniref:Uncharacterized protein n=2 Tax=Eucalyptus grandis TaxID=71139 RepID=A0ACC3LAW7_EUCGR|nr:hypothetical protein EUGRSUZ_C00585 [Eucalyptus grandis]